jgi:hypothetical protein
MMKALRKGVGKPAYLHGGQAEDMFQAQMDQQVAENLAKSHGGAFVKDLYQRFLIDHPENQPKQSAELSSLAQTAKSAPAAEGVFFSLAITAKSAPAAESAQAASWARPLTSVSRNTTGTGVIPAMNRK